MTVSIVIPCYNHGRFLAEAIDSALTQSWRDCEVVVVDDGSTDESAQVMAQYAEIRVVRQENRGLAAARNAGLHVARGDVLIFLDADDRLWPDAARCGVKLLRARPDAALVFGRCQLVNERGLPLPTTLPRVRARFFERLLLDNYIWTPGMVAFRRAVFDVVGGFDESISAAADYDIYLRITRQFPVANHSAITVDYRQHADNMSRDPVLMLDATLAALRGQRPFVLDDSERAEIYRRAMIRWRLCYGERLVEQFRTALRRRDATVALAAGWHLLRLYPAGVRHHMHKKLRLMVRQDVTPRPAPESPTDNPEPQSAARP